MTTQMKGPLSAGLVAYAFQRRRRVRAMANIAMSDDMRMRPHSERVGIEAGPAGGATTAGTKEKFEMVRLALTPPLSPNRNDCPATTGTVAVPEKAPIPVAKTVVVPSTA